MIEVEQIFTKQKNTQAQQNVEHEQTLQQNHFLKNELRNAEKIWTNHFDLKAAKYLADHNRLVIEIQALTANVTTLELEQKKLTHAHAAQLLQIRDAHNIEILDSRANFQELDSAFLTTKQELKHLQQAHSEELGRIGSEHTSELLKLNEDIQQHANSLLVFEEKLQQLQFSHVEELARTSKEHQAERSKLNTSLADLASKLALSEEEKSLQSNQYSVQIKSKIAAQLANQIVQEAKNTQQSGLLLNATQEIELLKQAQNVAENYQHHLALKIEQLNTEYADLLSDHKQQDQTLKNSNNANQLKIQSLDEAIQNWKLTAAGNQFEIDSIKTSKIWKFSKLLRVLSAKLFASDFAMNDVQKPNFYMQNVINAQGLAKALSDKKEATVKEIELITFKAATTENTEEIKMTNVNDLLDLHGESFLTQAYRIVLGRNPDPIGLANYMARLKSGTSKLELLSQLVASQEAKKVGSKFPGLHEITQRHKYSKLPFMGWYKPATEQLSKKLNVIENKLFEISSGAPNSRVAMLESEVAQHASYVEDKETYIARLLHSASKSDLTWDQFSTQILVHRESYKGIFVQEIIIDWDVPLYQRPQHIASALGRLGYLVIYRTANWTNDQVYGFRQVAKNVWLTASPEVDVIEGAVHSFYSTAFSIPPELISQRKASHRVIYEYIDHIDPQISGDAENIKRLLTLKDFAFNGGADFVVASAKLLQTEAINAVGESKVVLAQNGVDTRHYRNPIHSTTPLPEGLIAFRAKFTNLIGYFGALAPWLWYETITELVEARPDLGFVFIGPDYYGGAEKLPKSANVLYLGTVDYKILPAYARQFDVCFIPFAPSEIARTTSPLKLFEYFALEKPVVVTSEMSECVAFPEVFRGNSTITLSQAIDDAIHIKTDPLFKKRLAALADENDWDERARAMEVIFAVKPRSNHVSLATVQKIIIDGHQEDGLNKYYYKDSYSLEEELYWQPVPDWIKAIPNINSAIDIGAAYGTLLVFTALNQQCKILHAVDPVGYMSESIKNKFDIYLHSTDFEKNIVDTKQKFDLILFTEVIEHLNYAPVPTLLKIKNLMQKNGRLIVTTPDSAEWGQVTKYYAQLTDIPAYSGQNKPWIDGHIWQYTKNEIESVFKAAGLQVEKFAYAPGAKYRHLCYQLKIENS